jgi:hypothetical protein
MCIAGTEKTGWIWTVQNCHALPGMTCENTKPSDQNGSKTFLTGSDALPRQCALRGSVCIHDHTETR